MTRVTSAVAIATTTYVQMAEPVWLTTVVVIAGGGWLATVSRSRGGSGIAPAVAAAARYATARLITVRAAAMSRRVAFMVYLRGWAAASDSQRQLLLCEDVRLAITRR